MRAEGTNGFLELQGNIVILTRKFLFGKRKGAKRVAVRSISAVQFRPAGLLVSGFLQIAFQGSTESKRGLFDAAKDENTIMFTRRQQPAFEAIRDGIEVARDKPL